MAVVLLWLLACIRQKMPNGTLLAFQSAGVPPTISRSTIFEEQTLSCFCGCVMRGATAGCRAHSFVECIFGWMAVLCFAPVGCVAGMCGKCCNSVKPWLHLHLLQCAGRVDVQAIG
jgi:hypothetical protein